MTASKHTPGPWTFHRPWSGFSQITGPNDELVFGIAAGSVDEKRPDCECEANARLIAAAPDLLAALKTLSHYDQEPDAVGMTEYDAALAAALAAIARAEGPP